MRLRDLGQCTNCKKRVKYEQIFTKNRRMLCCKCWLESEKAEHMGIGERIKVKRS